MAEFRLKIIDYLFVICRNIVMVQRNGHYEKMGKAIKAWKRDSKTRDVPFEYKWATNRKSKK